MMPMFESLDARQLRQESFVSPLVRMPPFLDQEEESALMLA